MNDILTLIQVIIGIMLVVSILLQQKGAGIGGAFGGSAEVYSVKRGAEKAIFITTIILSVIFFGLGLARLVIG